MSTDRCLRIAVASSVSKSGLADSVGDGEGEAVGVGDAVAIGDAVGVGESLSSPPQATMQAARAMAAIRRTRRGDKVVVCP
jgi:hypothetical protein